MGSAPWGRCASGSEARGYGPRSTRSGLAPPGEMAVPDRADEVKCFGRHKGGVLRDGVILSVEPLPMPHSTRNKIPASANEASST